MEGRRGIRRERSILWTWRRERERGKSDRKENEAVSDVWGGGRRRRRRRQENMVVGLCLLRCHGVRKDGVRLWTVYGSMAVAWRRHEGGSQWNVCGSSFSQPVLFSKTIIWAWHSNKKKRKEKAWQQNMVRSARLKENGMPACLLLTVLAPSCVAWPPVFLLLCILYTTIK